MTKAVTPERLSELETSLDFTLQKKKVTKGDLESLVHKLLWVSTCVKSSRCFVYRILSAMKQLRSRHHHIRLDPDTKADIIWWRRFIRSFSGVSLIDTNIWSEPDQLVAGDACLESGGAYTSDEYFSIVFPQFCKDIPIHILEFLVLIISC